jgi:hypothetical protein
LTQPLLYVVNFDTVIMKEGIEPPVNGLEE